MSYDADVIVVGAGIAGLSAARELAGRARDVLVLERFEVGHASGSSGGPTRMFRLAYDHPRYTRMARIALGRWRDLESVAGEPLLVTTGGIDLGARAQVCEDSLRAAGEPFARPRAAEIVERWPSIVVHDDDLPLLHEDAGVCLADAAVAATARLGKAQGVRIREHAKVERIESHGDAVTVTVDGEELRAPMCVVASGAWAPGLLAPLDIRLPLSITKEQVTYFLLAEADTLPTIVEWTQDGHRTPYALPDPRVPGAFKAALHHAGDAVDPDTRDFDPHPGRVAEVRAFAARRYAAHEPTGETDTCLYSTTPDEDFVIDRRGPVVVASPCSGHGFKFAPLVGELIADVATDSSPVVPLDAFALDRPTLRA